MRHNVSFDSAGTKCAAWFYQPDGKGPFPAVVMAHGLAGVKEMRLDAYAERFCSAGFACLVFDYRHFGESDGEPRQLLDIKRQHRDWQAAVAHARSLPVVDGSKIVLWGSSLSGGHVLKVGSLEPAVAAVIAQVPHLDGIASLRMNSLAKMLKLALHGSYDLVRAVLGLSPHYILSSAEPDELGLMNAPGESAGYLNLMPKGKTLDRRVAARFALQIGSYSPVRVLSQLKMPVLIQVGNDDLTTPAAPAIKGSQGITNVTLKRYDTGHFQPYVEPMFATIIRDQLEFLKAATKTHSPQ